MRAREQSGTTVPSHDAALHVQTRFFASMQHCCPEAGAQTSMRSAFGVLTGPQRHDAPPSMLTRSQVNAIHEQPPFLSFAKASSEQQSAGSPSDVREHAASVPLGLSRESQSHRTDGSTLHFTTAAPAAGGALDSEHAAAARTTTSRAKVRVIPSRPPHPLPG